MSSMTRQMRRASHANGRRMQRRPWDEFKDVTADARERHILLGAKHAFKPDLVFLNTRYSVQVFQNQQVIGLPATKLMIRRNDSEPVVAWGDLQRIKNELFGEHAMALQVFPAQDELIDVANIYWLWVLKVQPPVCALPLKNGSGA